MRSRGLLVVLLLALASGCMASKETRRGANELEDALGTPDWAAAVSVRSGLDGQFADQVLTEVTLNDSATPEDVSAFVVAMPGRVVDAGLADVAANKQLRFVSRSGARLEIGWAGAVDADEVGRGVGEWFGVGDALGGAVDADVRSDGGASYVVTMGDGARSAVEGAYETLGSLTQPDTGWAVDATAGDLALRLSGTVLPTDDQLGVWRAMLAALDELPADLPASALSLAFGDRIVADLTVIAPDDTTTESFTLASYGDRIWPVVHPQLDAMKTLPGAWSYFVNWSPTYAPLQDNLFISLLSDQPTIDNGDEATRWSQAAADYVSRAGRVSRAGGA